MSSRPATWRRLVIGLWLLGVLAAAAIITRTTFSADLSAFLPQSPTEEQQVLLDQLREGVASRLILVGIAGNPELRAPVAKAMAAQLRKDASFDYVNNGEAVHLEQDRKFLFENRYLLSPGVTPERFTVPGLHQALQESIHLLASPAGMMVKPLLPRDPTGEMMRLLEQMAGSNRPQMRDGVWTSRDGSRALLLARTRAAGSDTDAQQEAMRRIEAAFKEALRQQQAEPGAGLELLMTGPGVFSVVSRETIKSEVSRLSVISIVVVISLLLLVYRSFTALALGLLPVISGALAGVVAVSLGFGVVHGITLGFGITLIGEAVDYSIYLFIQSRQSSVAEGSAPEDWTRRFWPTIQLGVLTSIVGFASLLLSSFPGLAQLGAYSIAGLVTAALVTRYVLPQLLPRNFRIRDVSAIGRRLTTLAGRAPQLRWPFLLLTLAACLVVLQQRDHLWNVELSSLSPVPEADQRADAQLRGDLGAPDVRYMVVVSGADQEAALASAEKVAQHLEPLIAQGALAGFETPSRYLPSRATQQARKERLPQAQELTQRLKQAVQGLPVRPEIFTPFVADVAAAKNRAPLTRSDLQNSSFAMAVDSLLFQRGDVWKAVLPLTAPTTAEATGLSTKPIRAALAAAGVPGALFVDLKAESDKLYEGYLDQALILSLTGLLAIAALLLLSLRSISRVAAVLLPLLAAVAVVVALLALSGQRLTILHLIGLLLVVAVGSNYALFFSSSSAQRGDTAMSSETLTSLVFANLTTVASFGILGFSDVPVLKAIGSTVGPGAVLALLFAASFRARSRMSAVALEAK